MIKIKPTELYFENPLDIKKNTFAGLKSIQYQEADEKLIKGKIIILIKNK